MSAGGTVRIGHTRTCRLTRYCKRSASFVIGTADGRDIVRFAVCRDPYHASKVWAETEGVRDSTPSVPFDHPLFCVWCEVYDNITPDDTPHWKILEQFRQAIAWAWADGFQAA